MKKKILPLAESYPSLAGEWHPTKNGDLTPLDVTPGSGRKVWWRCAHGHEWQAQVRNRVRSSGCPICAGRFTQSLAISHPALVGEWHPTKNGELTPQDVTPGSSKKVWWRCAAGHEWQAAVFRRVHGSGCPICAGRSTESLAISHPTLAGEWHPTKNGELTPQDVTPGSHKKVWWCCTASHEWQATVVNRARGIGCPICAGRFTESLAISHPALAGEWHPTKNGELTPQDVTPGSHKKVWWLCSKGHEWQAQIAQRVHGTGCPICAKEKRGLEKGVKGSNGPEDATSR